MASRKLNWIFFLLIFFCFSLSADLFAQGKSKSNGPPPWAPAHGYRAKTKHIYFPGHNFYYDVEQGVYIYVKGEKWEVSAKLPDIFNNVDLNVASKVELDVRTTEPQKYNTSHMKKYGATTAEVGHSSKKKNNKNKKGKKKG